MSLQIAQTALLIVGWIATLSVAFQFGFAAGGRNLTGALVSVATQAVEIARRGRGGQLSSPESTNREGRAGQ
jgi:hypothetical protein